MNIVVNDCSCNIKVEDSEFEEGYNYLYIIQLNQSDNKVTTASVMKTDENQNIVFKFSDDGFYTFCRIKLATSPGEGYYTDGKKFFLNGQEVQLKELIEDTDETSSPDIPLPNIEYQAFFSTCHLKKCYISLCKQILDKTLFGDRKCCTNNVDKDLTYRRDLVWSVYNVIQYMLDFGQYHEAQRLLERVNGCNGLCSEFNDSNCGCS